MDRSRRHVLLPAALDVRVRRAAHRQGVSRGEWVRRALEEVLTKEERGPDPLIRLASLEAPTADIGRMLAEIAGGRS